MAEPITQGEPTTQAPPAARDGASPGAAPNIHTTAGKLEDLRRREEAALHAGSARAVEKRHGQGRKTARERVEALLDEGSFVELDR